MKRNIITLGTILTILIGLAGVTQTNNKTLKTDIHAIRIPTGTIMQLELTEPISSKTGSIGDIFSAMTTKDKIVNGKIALPAGSLVRGTIKKITPNKRLSRSAVVYFEFDHVVTPTGRQIPISAGLYNFNELTLDGGVYQGGNYGYALQQNWIKSQNILSKSINWGKGTGDNMQYICVPLGAVGGFLGGTGYYAGMAVADLYQKGNDVNWKQGKNFQIMLTKPLDIPLH